MGRQRTRPLRCWFGRIDIRVLRRVGRISPGLSGVGSLEIAWVTAPFGGVRPLWVCPVCSRRCAVLLRARRPGAPHGTACGTCQRVSYETTAMQRVDRLFARRDAILARLGIRGCTPGPAKAVALKPKGMHVRTFLRELERARQFEALALATGLEAITGRRFDA